MSDVVRYVWNSLHSVRSRATRGRPYAYDPTTRKHRTKIPPGTVKDTGWLVLRIKSVGSNTPSGPVPGLSLRDFGFVLVITRVKTAR